MADVKWIKITTNIFDEDGKLFAIETLPDGHLIELVWFKLLVLTGKLNNNGLLINAAKIPYTDEMLSQAFRIDIGTIQRAIEIFERAEMIEVVDNAYMISGWLEHQSGDRLEDIKKQNRERQQKHRDKQKALALEEKRNVTNNVTGDVTNNVNCSISISNSNSISNIINYLNKATNSKYSDKTRDTVKHINARFAEGHVEQDFYDVIDKKVAEWTGTEFEKFLRPATLFGTKFENYLNQKTTNKKRNDIDENWRQTIVDVAGFDEYDKM